MNNQRNDFLHKLTTKIVKENNLPPKILVIHRYRKNMVTNAEKIETLPEVQVVMNMDGWGTPSVKVAIYNQYIYKEPVEFLPGFKTKDSVIKKALIEFSLR